MKYVHFCLFFVVLESLYYNFHTDLILMLNIKSDFSICCISVNLLDKIVSPRICLIICIIVIMIST